MHKTIVIIEDVQDMAHYMRDVLTEDGHQVYVSLTGTEGLKLTRQLMPEIVLLDLNLPDINGRSLCEQIKDEFPELTLIMVTGEDTPASVASGLNLGADDYITKPVSPEVLLARIHARTRSVTNDAHVLQVNDLTLNQKTHVVKRGDKDIQLSAQEFKLLEYLMENPNQVLTREMILARIWKSSPDIQTRVVDVYVGYLRKKIEFKEPKLIHSIRGFGYMLSENPPA
ncbi:response regulator transcription factor [Candidatus Woesebacteria bacterium]|nr:response regulator transcription factor [Candidatus Woesebacteria bacterium]MCD8507440.1 response regulator transcription factor [Candidatus Woesebacteria bacterium]MCD8526869.1 response regulator transcription factor [Candidatus Woesebacteria bacterium]MCD8545793.1 response regulator transcription factor [Candidatus Woesebacteria bacterium]